MLQMPDLLYFNGSWQEYIDDVYDVVREDILISNITFKGLLFDYVIHRNIMGKNSDFGI